MRTASIFANRNVQIMKLGVAAELSLQILEQAKAKGIDALVFHRIRAEVKPEHLVNFTLHDTSKLTAAGKEYAYKSVEQRLQKLESKFPNLFYYKQFNLKEAILKELYWALIIDNLNEQKCRELTYEARAVIHLDEPKNSISQYFKYLARIIQPVIQVIGIIGTTDLNTKIAIRINSARALPFFGNLLSTLPGDRFCCFQSATANEPHQTATDLKSKGYEVVDFVFKSKIVFSEIGTYLFLLGHEEISFLTLLLLTKNRLKTILDQYETLALNGAKGFLLNAGENEGEGIIAGIIAAHHAKKAFNFMNGTKAKDPINQHTTFQQWFMHDTRMQQMFLSYSNLKKENLPVIGHLLEDTASNHHYSGTLDAWQEQLKNKKIIALFSSIIYNQERSDVAEFLQSLLDELPDVIVLIRQHPSETQQVAYTHKRSIILPDFKEKSALALFDLMQAATLAISFGSTVSLQASWFGIPSATVEYAEKSLLFYVDQEKIHHFNSIPELAKFVKFALNQPKSLKQNSSSEKSVAQKMTEYLLS